jgi:hypothetical protein
MADHEKDYIPQSGFESVQGILFFLFFFFFKVGRISITKKKKKKKKNGLGFVLENKLIHYYSFS